MPAWAHSATSSSSCCAEQELSSDSSPCWVWPVPVLFLPAVLPTGAKAAVATASGHPCPSREAEERKQSPQPSEPMAAASPSQPAPSDQIWAPLRISQHCRAPTLAGHPAPAPAPVFGTSHAFQRWTGQEGASPLSSEPWSASAVQVGKSCLCHVPGTAQPCDSGLWEMRGVKVQPSGSLRTGGNRLHKTPHGHTGVQRQCENIFPGTQGVCAPGGCTDGHRVVHHHSEIAPWV